MRIRLDTIQHKDQRYPTVGDWYFINGGIPGEGTFAKNTMQINVSDLGDWRKELCVAVHELIETAIAINRGVTVKEVDEFDIQFEDKREAALNMAKTEAEKNLLLFDEPGDNPGCPIKREHSIATGIERILAAELGVDWKPYEEQIESL